jgi:DNA ligase D-like protein (predicted 3'-phosphoesterase)
MTRHPAQLGGRFVVHEHRARRLHFDLRLQVGDRLKSWAVPKGPSMNPAEKRLAIQVADHPIEYLGFEGIIAGGHAGAGPVVVWDHGIYLVLPDQTVEAQLRAGKLLFFLNGTKLRGWFALVRLAGGGEDHWLLIKRRDRHADSTWHVYSELTPNRVRSLAEVIPPW